VSRVPPVKLTTHPMATYSIVPTAEVADKYLALAEQSCIHIAELYQTGRWRHYYSETELLA
jgi:hypothetical protein